MSQFCGSGLSNRSNVTSAANSPDEPAARKMPPITGARAAHLPIRAMPKAFSMNLIVCMGFLRVRIIVVLLLAGTRGPHGKICGRPGAHYALTRVTHHARSSRRVRGIYIG